MAMTEYLAPDDLVGRLTQVGMLYVADRNKDGIVDPTEQTLYVTPCIIYAGNLVDGFICDQVVVGTARANQVPWLKDRAIDFAAHQACHVGAKDIPKSVKEMFEFSIRLMKTIQEGKRIPGYPYVGPINSWYINHAPKVANPGSTFRRPATLRGTWPY